MLMLVAATPVMAQVGESGQQVDGKAKWRYIADCGSQSSDKSDSPGAALQACVPIFSKPQVIGGWTYTYTYGVTSVPAVDNGGGAYGTLAGSSCRSHPTEPGGGCSPVSVQVWVYSVNDMECPDSAVPGAPAFPNTCWCPVNTKPTPDKKACEPVCAAGVTMSSGYYDIGAGAGANPPLMSCKSRCEVVFDGSSPAGSALVGGTKHWFAKGEYVSTGNKCPGSSTTELGQSTSGVPKDSCGEGQVLGEVNGKPYCANSYKPDGSGGDQTDGSKDKESKQVTTESGINGDGSKWEKTTAVTVDRDGNKTTTTTTTTTGTDGTKTTTEQTVHEGRPGGSEAADPEDPDDPEKTECEKNPSGKDCGGSPAAVGESYSKRAGTKTFQEVLQGAADALSGTEFGGAVNRFFSVSGGGSCPVISGHIPFINATFSFDAFCTSMASIAFVVIRSVLLLVASFLAFRIAME